MASETPKKKGIYFGWWIVFSSFMIMFLQYAPAVNLFGLYVPSLAAEFQASRTAIVSIMSIGTLASVVGSMFAGKTLIKYGIRRIWVICSLLCAATYVLNANANSLTILYVSAFLRGLFGAAISTIPISILINSWFGKKIKGRAMGISLMGSGIGAMILNPVVGYIIATYGWRTSYYFFAVLLIIMIPIGFPTFVLSPKMKGLERIGDAPEEAGKEVVVHGMTSKEALGSGVFWLAFIAMTILAGTAQSWSNNGASYLTDLQFDPIVVASIMSITSLGLTIGKPVFGAVSDKWGNKVGVTAGALTLIAGYLLMVASSRVTGIAIVGAGVTGAGIAVVNVLLPLITADLFGNRDYPALVGYMQISASLGATLIPLGVTMVFDTTGSFIPAWFGLSVAAVVCIILIFTTYKLRDARKAKMEQATKTTA